MNTEFNNEINAHLTLDGDKVVGIDHRQNMWQSPVNTPRNAAEAYLNEMAPVLGLSRGALANLNNKATHDDPQNAPPAFRLSEEKTFFDATTVGYYQTLNNVPIWGAGLTVTVKHGPSRVLSTVSTSRDDAKGGLPDPKRVETHKRLLAIVKRNALLGEDALEEDDAADRFLNSLLDTEATIKRGKLEEVKARASWKKGRFFMYRYEADKRFTDRPAKEVPIGLEDEGGFQHEHDLRLPLPDVDPSLQEGRYYLVNEVIFERQLSGHGAINWRALVEVGTNSVLYLRALTDHVNGLVFEHAPITTSGDVNNSPDKSNAVQNPFRTDVVLQNLVAPSGGNQALTGTYGTIVEIESPTVAAPAQPTGTDFDFDVRTDQFSAVNAYYHHDRMFRLMEDLGFPVSTYMDGTTFPVRVDHRGLGNVLNAHCVGNGSGITHVCYALANTADTANPIGIATDWRVHLHEVFGHGILYDHVGTANFGFAHSAGDSFAAILSDPWSALADRFATFPGLLASRRHDRDVAAGWGWGGASDAGGYNSEQILCTTMFRIYQSIGGDSTHASRKEFAARMTAYLLLRAIGTLTPATNPSNALGLCNALMAVDLLNWTSEGYYGGAYNKLIRWSFEKQGLFQPAGAPTPVTTAGAPPTVDVYIDDGRRGEYQFQPAHWRNTSIWNRTSADGGLTHQDPIIGATNYAYVKLKNRGSAAASDVTVRGYHTLPGAGLTWPNDFEEFGPAGGITVASVPANNSGEVIVGPFTWSPNINAYGHDCMLMVASCAADPSNVDHITAGESIEEWRLVPNDNNIGQRNVNPVPGAGGIRGLIAAIHDRFFIVRNPFRKPVKGCEVKVKLPAVLEKRGWAIGFKGVANNTFPLALGEKRTLVMQVKAGTDFSAAEIREARDREITMEVLADGILIGGMSYQLDPEMKAPNNTEGGGSDDKSSGGNCNKQAQDLLRCLKIDGAQVDKVCITKVSLDIKMDHDCGCKG